MAQSLAKVTLHIVFSTKNREPFLTETIRKKLYGYMVGVLHENDCIVIEIGGMEDHIHALVLMPRAITLSKLVEVMKSNSSRWMKKQSEKSKHFAWKTVTQYFP